MISNDDIFMFASFLGLDSQQTTTITRRVSCTRATHNLSTKLVSDVL